MQAKSTAMVPGYLKIVQAKLLQSLQAICDDAVQNVVQICSTRLSPWMMAHIPDLLLMQPSARPVLEQILPHTGCTQASVQMLT